MNRNFTFGSIFSSVLQDSIKQPSKNEMKFYSVRVKSRRAEHVRFADRPFRKIREGLVVTESYCPACGLFIAASPRPQILALAERLHRCNVRSTRPVHEEAFTGAAQIVACALGTPDTPPGLRQLMAKLVRREHALQQWLQLSEANARWFCQDPVAALRAANLGIEEEVLLELESVTRTIAQKLNPRQ